MIHQGDRGRVEISQGVTSARRAEGLVISMWHARGLVIAKSYPGQFCAFEFMINELV